MNKENYFFEESISLEQHRFRTVMEELHAAVFEWNFVEDVFYSSEAYQDYAISQVSNEKILSNSGPMDLVHPDDIPILLKFFKETDTKKEKVEAVLRLKKMDGSYCWCRMIAFFYYDEKGTVLRTVGMIIDIHGDYEQQMELQNLIDRVPTGIGIYEIQDGQVFLRYLNDAYYALLGMTRESRKKYYGEHALEAVHPDDQESMMRAVKHLAAGAQRENVLHRVCNKDGKWIWLNLVASVIERKEGFVKVYAAFSDCDDMVRTQQILKDNQKKEKALMESIPGGVVIYRMKKDRSLGVDYVSEGFAKMCGYDSVEELRTNLNGDVMKNVAKQDIPVVLDAIEQSIKTHDAMSVMYHIPGRNQENILNRIDANVIEGEIGEDDLLVWYAIHTKVSEESQKILKEQQTLRKLIDEVPAGIGIYEIQDGKLLQIEMNEAFYDMIGISREDRKEYDGENTLKAVHPDDLPNISKTIEKITEKGHNNATVTYRIKGVYSAWFWVNLSISVVERREHYLKVYAAFSDYNAVMQAQKELENGKITMQVALETAKVMTWRYDYKENLITDSGTLGEAFHLPKVIGDLPQSILDMGFVADESIEDFKQAFVKLKQEKTVSVDVKSTVKNENGTSWYRIIYTPSFDEFGDYSDYVGIAIDITEQKVREHKYEEQLKLKKIAAQGALVTASYNLSQNVMTECDSSLPELTKIMEQTCADDILREIRHMILDEGEQENFKQIYDCETIIDGFARGERHIQIRHHLKGYRGWLQTTFDMISNPYTGDVEAIGVLHDITELVRAELVIDRLLIVDYHAIFTIDVKTGEAIPFQDKEYNSDVKELILDHSIERVKEQLENQAFYETMFSFDKDGVMIHYRAIYTYLEKTKDVILCAVQDVTEALEQEERQKEELQGALIDAQKANLAKTAFLSRVSHDMRTPLNGMLGLSTLMRSHTTNPKMKEDLDELELSGKYLLNLINDTLDVSRIEAGKLELHPVVCDGRAVIYNALSLAKTNMESKDIQYKIHTDNLPFSTLYLDVGRVEQVFMNIIGNAVKFTPEGGKISISIENISVDDGLILDRVIVEDQGCGMSEEFLPHLFEPFVQEDATRTSSAQGTGLGMSITKEILKIMGGDIQVESILGKGTKVSFTLPLPIATKEQINQWKQSINLTNNKERLQGKRILLCEDHPLNTKISTRLLEAKGAIVEHAENGKVGLEMFEKSEQKYYDAILMDIRMPVMDGLDATKAIRELPRRDARLIPIIAMTANAFEDDIRKTQDVGMDAHLSKPVETELLYGTLEELLAIDRDIKRRTVLIVDDMEVNRAVLRSSIEMDYDILEARDGEEALEVLEDNPGIDAMITDIQMPRINGTELIRRVRKNEKYDHIAIIANTQFGDREQEEELLRLGADDFVYKPTTPKIVEIRVRNALRKM